MIKKSVPYVLITASGLSRVLPHPPNFTATNSAINYSNYSVKSFFSIILPLVVFLIGDTIRTYIIYESEFTLSYMLEVYGAYLILSGLCKYVSYKDTKIKPIKIGSLIITSSIFFFLWSNFFVYLNETIRTFLEVYYDALPFLGYEIAGNIIYSVIFFTIHYFVFEYKNNIHIEDHTNDTNESLVVKQSNDTVIIQDNSNINIIHK